MLFSHLILTSILPLYTLGLDLDTSDSSSICDAASIIATGALHYYDGSTMEVQSVVLNLLIIGGNMVLHLVH